MLLVASKPRFQIPHRASLNPDLNPAYQEMALRYGVGVVPARPYRPRDKVRMEVGVQIAEHCYRVFDRGSYVTGFLQRLPPIQSRASQSTG